VYAVHVKVAVLTVSLAQGLLWLQCIRTLSELQN